MKWQSDWWGITIESESKQDDTILALLKELLPEHTRNCYDTGKVTTDISETGHTMLVFER